MPIPLVPIAVIGLIGFKTGVAYKLYDRYRKRQDAPIRPAPEDGSKFEDEGARD
ncbi:hypothetical protein [Pseudosulfitobacter pseudonitzschiae]|uniref:hypothetical protein n=1 Tax=Pseudosulfitobacter pseudonitzschiae TaxID=1402135 RepID=UPI003B7ED401